MLLGERGSWLARRIAQETGSGAFFWKNQASATARKSSSLLSRDFSKIASNHLSLSVAIPALARANARKRLEIAVERARERVSLEQPYAFLDDRAQVLPFDDQPPLEAVEEEKCIADVGRAAQSGRSPATRGSWRVVGLSFAYVG